MAQQGRAAGTTHEGQTNQKTENAFSIENRTKRKIS